MKTKLHLSLLTMLLAAMSGMTFWSCESESETSPAPITVQDEQVLTQNVYADNTQGNNVQFTTAGAWTSSITTSGNAVPVPGSMRAVPTEAPPPSTSGTATWISISPDHGDKEGTYTIAITLSSNTTGADRTAVITILCESTEIFITVTQKAVKEDGTIPEEEEPSSDLPQALQSALSQLKEENDEIYIENISQQYQIYISTWETTHYVFSFNRNAKKLYEQGFNYTTGNPQQYIENSTVYVASESGKRRYHIVTDSEKFWSETPVSYYIDETVSKVGRTLNSAGLQYHQWTVAGNIYTGHYTHEGLTDTVKFTLTGGKITAISSYRTQSLNAPYIYKNNVTIAYTAVPNITAGTVKNEYTPVGEQHPVKFVWGEGLGETTFYTGHYATPTRGFGVYLPENGLQQEDVAYYAPTLQGKRIEGFYKNAACTETDEMISNLFYGKPLYVSDDNTVVYVKWINE